MMGVDLIVPREMFGGEEMIKLIDDTKVAPNNATSTELTPGI